MVRNALCVYKNRIQVIPLELRVMFFTVLTEDDIGKNSKSNEATKHFHCWSIFMFQSRKSVDDGIVRSYSHNYLLGTVADFFLSQSFTYILPLLNPTKISGGGGGRGSPIWREWHHSCQNYFIELNYYMTVQNRHNDLA